MWKSLFSSVGSEKNLWLTTQRFIQYALIASQSILIIIELSTTGSFQNQHYSKEIYTWCYRKPSLISMVLPKLHQTLYWLVFGNSSHQDLVLRFLKRAASNLQQPFKVIVPSRKLPPHDRRRILAKQLADFVHIYNKVHMCVWLNTWLKSWYFVHVHPLYPSLQWFKREISDLYNDSKIKLGCYYAILSHWIWKIWNVIHLCTSASYGLLQKGVWESLVQYVF